MRWPCIRGSCLNTSYEAVEKNIWVSATKDRNTLFVLKDSQMISFTLSYENSPQTRMILARSQSKFVLVCIVCVGPSAGVQVVPLPETQAQWSSSKQIKKRALFHSSGNWYRTAISVLRTVKPTSLIAGKKGMTGMGPAERQIIRLLCLQLHRDLLLLHPEPSCGTRQRCVLSFTSLSTTETWRLTTATWKPHE